jgi:hypothetical protein
VYNLKTFQEQEMKIIAKTEKGLLLEATDLEIANLHGYQSFHAHGAPDSRALQIGYELPLAKIVKAAKLIRDLNPSTLKEIHKQLCDAQREVEVIQELANSLVLFDILKEESTDA